MSKLYVDEIHPKTSGSVPSLMNVPHLSVGFSGSSTSVSQNDNIFDTSETGAHIIDSRHDITISDTGNITINTSGIYSVSFYSISSTQYCYVEIEVNGDGIIRPYVNSTSDSNFTWVTASGSAIFSLDAGDIITVKAGESQTLHGNHHTRFTAYMIGGK